MNKRSDGISCKDLKGINVNLPKSLYERLWVTSKLGNKSINSIVTSLLEGYFSIQDHVSYECMSDFEVHEIYDVMHQDWSVNVDGL